MSCYRHLPKFESVIENLDEWSEVENRNKGKHALLKANVSTNV